MVSITPLIILGIVGLAIIFNKQIADFLREFKPSEQVQQAIETVTAPVKEAGITTGKAVGENIILPINIAKEEAKIEQTALDAGFPSLAEAEKALDAGSIVIGGKKTVVDFGLIGDVLPTDPSPEFLANPEKFLTPDQLKAFLAQQEEQKLSQTVFGGQQVPKITLTTTTASTAPKVEEPAIITAQQPDLSLVSPFLKAFQTPEQEKEVITAEQPDLSLVSPFLKAFQITEEEKEEVTRGELRFGR